MVNDRLIFFNTGWMDFYRGIQGDTIKGGGEYIRIHGWGGEMYNFRSYRNKCYGYVQPTGKLNLERIGGSTSDDKLENVTVVWTATDPVNQGTYIVGWYQNATVFRYHQDLTGDPLRTYEGQPIGYHAKARKEDVRLLPVDERVVRIKRQQKGWMGQSNVWYAEENPMFVKAVREYINSGKAPSTLVKPRKIGNGLRRQQDVLKRIEVEKRAIDIVTIHFAKRGFVVESFEKDNLGWDLEASNEKTTLKLEVKGLSGHDIIAELTANEYNCMLANRKLYRLCIVTNTLNTPKLNVFSYSAEKNAWADENGLELGIQETRSARVIGQ